MKKLILIGIIAIAIVFGSVTVTVAGISTGSANVYLDDNRLPAKSGAACVTNVTQAQGVGNQISSTILSTSTSRAYARVQRVTDNSGMATSGPVFLSFDKGAAAVLGAGISLSTSTPYIEFGLDTTFPYTGAVTGITVVGSTTLLVTACAF